MKNLSFFVSAFALCASTSYAAINCGTLPSCSDLGYTDKVAECPSSSEVLKCPFDTTYGKCTRGPSIGDLKYSLNTTNHNGWILCNGQSLDTTKYAALYGIIKSNYGMDGTKFRVPDYRGFFLRAKDTAYNNNALSSYGGSANTSLDTPQEEQLPNVGGTFPTDDTGYHDSVGHWWKISKPDTKITVLASCTAGDPCQNRFVSGAFSFYNRPKDSEGYATPKGPDGTGAGGFAQFQAKHSNPIYTDSGHVIPANYAANIFIYAGR